MKEEILKNYKAIENSVEREKFIFELFATIAGISDCEYEKIDKYDEQYEVLINEQKQIKNHLNQVMKELQRGLNNVHERVKQSEHLRIKILEEEKRALEKEKIELEKQRLALEKELQLSNEEIDGLQEKLSKQEKKIQNSYKVNLQSVRDSLIDVAHTTQSIKSIIEKDQNQDLVTVANNILLYIKNSSEQLEHIGLWPEQETKPNIERIELPEVIEEQIEQVEEVKVEQTEPVEENITVNEVEKKKEPSKRKKKTSTSKKKVDEKLETDGK